ncbi:MAG: hypothetical protein B6D41_10455 [Chloroflexi bacterium UTCFX4]|jgi:hypothetical protein|nr:MAG: hypothetical protein B6D41_10455 [Chloroflexi bacterium UTCFX4]
MKQRTAILLATGLTAFVVVVVVAIAFSITWKGAVSQAAQPKAGMVEYMNGAAEQQINAPAAPTTNSPATTATAQPKIVSADDATRVARALFAGDTLAQPPELVNYKGKMAYEVVLGGGTVYVDAFTGKVLTSVLAAASNSTSSESKDSSYSQPTQYDDDDDDDENYDHIDDHDSDENDDEHD